MLNWIISHTILKSFFSFFTPSKPTGYFCPAFQSIFVVCSIKSRKGNTVATAACLNLALPFLKLIGDPKPDRRCYFWPIDVTAGSRGDTWYHQRQAAWLSDRKASAHGASAITALIHSQASTCTHNVSPSTHVARDAKWEEMWWMRWREERCVRHTHTETEGEREGGRERRGGRERKREMGGNSSRHEYS